METQRRTFGLCYSLLVGVFLVFFSGIGSSAVSNEVKRCDPHSNDSDSSISCSSKNYVLQSYYEKYEDLLDSNFQDFIAQELPIGLCEVLPHNLSLALRLSILHRNLIGNGSHRHLTSSFRLKIEQESILELPSHHCEVIVIERLPSGVFADPFELQHLLQRGVYGNIAVFGDTNLELPSFLSNRSAVEVHMDVGHDLLLGPSKESTINLELPLHARYPPLDESGYWEVKFGTPDFFMRCSVEGKSHNQSCLYRIPDIDGSDSTFGTVVWNIPSGMKAHARIVSVFTFIAALISAILIAVTSIFYSDNSSKHSKES
ncbi:phosphatidylinositol-glycan biosynthesis class X protein [Rosa sericea]